MADCLVHNAALKSAVDEIKTLAGQYSQVGLTFETSFKNSLASMEGEAKDAVMELFDSKYKEFVTSMENGIPAMISGMSSLLEANRANFEEVDTKIAQSIREGAK